MEKPVNSLLHGLRAFIYQHRLIDRGEKVIVAISGGIDSMVLLDALTTLRQDLSIDLAIAHFNHQLRGLESDEDESYVCSVAKIRQLEYYVERADTALLAEEKKLSLQEAARNLRYDFFHKLRTSLGFQKIATAHTADDNAETLMFNLFRGAGVRGMTGIPIYRRDISVIRPFLFATREQIVRYAKERQIHYREDSSNLQQDYTRNFIRQQLMPLIRSNINPNLIETLRRTGELFGQLDQFLDRNVLEMLPRLVSHRSSEMLILNHRDFTELPGFYQEYILLRTARDFARSEVDSGTVRAMLRVAHAETGSSCSVSGEIVLYKNRDQLVFRHGRRPSPFRHPITIENEYELEDYRFRISRVTTAAYDRDRCVEYVDGDRFGKNLELRSWREGDRFVPLGMAEKKKLSDFFIDQKIPLFEKDRIPLLVSDGEIVWVCGHRLDDRFKITPQTTQILKLEYRPRTHTP